MDDVKQKKTVTGIIEEVCEEMCNNYCKYTDMAYDHLDQDEIFEKCEDCPLNRL